MITRRVRRRRGPLPAGAGAVRCYECGTEARADGKGSPIVLRCPDWCTNKVTR